MEALTRLDISDGVATLALHRPEVLNALSAALIEQLIASLQRLRADPAVRALVLTGSGRAFCVGADLRDPRMAMDLPAEQRGERLLATCDSGIHALARALMHFGKPTVVAVNGPAVGGGSSLALAGDIVLAARSAYFQQPFVPQLGIGPDMGGSWHLMRRLGPGRAIGAVLLGDRIAATQAAEWGLVWQCVEDDALAATARELAQRLARGAPQAMGRVQALMRAGLDNDFDTQLDAERDLQAALVRTRDFAEGVQAFRERRQPLFTGS